MHLTRIYTRTGDDGTTGLSDFSPGVARPTRGWSPTPTATRPTPRIGVAIALGQPDERIAATVLRQIQNDLFDVGADLSHADRRGPGVPAAAGRPQDYIDRLEGWCDEFNEELPALDSFILPGGTAAVGAAARRAHGDPARRAVGLGARSRPTPSDTVNALPANYLNRLSDLLFILSRVANPDGDVLWQPGRRPQRDDQRDPTDDRVRRSAPRRAATGRDSSQDRNAGQRAAVERDLVAAAAVRRRRRAARARRSRRS